MKRDAVEPPRAESSRRRWKTPRLARLGTLRELVQGGAGKLSVLFDADGRKPTGFG